MMQSGENERRNTRARARSRIWNGTNKPRQVAVISVSCGMMIGSRCRQLLSFFALGPGQWAESSQPNRHGVLISWYLSIWSPDSRTQSGSGLRNYDNIMATRVDFTWRVVMGPISLKCPQCHSCSPNHGVLAEVFVIISVQEQICYNPSEVKVASMKKLCGKIFFMKNIPGWCWDFY